jgi:hypothetical protein
MSKKYISRAVADAILARQAAEHVRIVEMADSDENARALVEAEQRDGEAGIYRVLRQIADQAVARVDVIAENTVKQLHAAKVEFEGDIPNADIQKPFLDVDDRPDAVELLDDLAQRLSIRMRAIKFQR